MEQMCRFCNFINQDTPQEENKIIYETNEYFAIASIGAFIEGWVLLAPKKHLVSMKDLYSNEQFVRFASHIITLIKNEYNSPIIAFEHGPNKCDSKTSCGTNHAHLHLVPYAKSLYNSMITSGLSWELCRPTQIESIAGSNEYLFYCEMSHQSIWDDPIGYIHVLQEPISQYFRKILAKQSNCFDKYDYKEYPFLETTILTSNVLRNSTIGR